MEKPQKIVVVGAGPVGSLAALYAAQRGHEVEVYELRPGKWYYLIILTEHGMLAHREALNMVPEGRCMFFENVSTCECHHRAFS